MKTSPALKKIRIFWERHVEGWRLSGLNQAAYSREHELSLKSLSYWIRRKHSLQKTPVPSPGNFPTGNIPAIVNLEPVKFIPVSGGVVKEAVGKFLSPAILSLYVGRQFRVDIPSDFSPETLARVIRVLAVF